MKNLSTLLLCLLVSTLYGAANFSHNTYEGVEITPESLLKFVSPVLSDFDLEAFDTSVDEWMGRYQEFVSKLVTTPRPLTQKESDKKAGDNVALISQFEQRGEVKNLSAFNYVLQFTGYDFTVPINLWKSRMANLFYSAKHKDALSTKPKSIISYADIDEPSYQHCSRFAHYLRLAEISKKEHFQFLKTAYTCLKHIPGKPTILSDEHYVAIQQRINKLQEIKHLPEREQITLRKEISPQALKEIYVGTTYAALWDIRANLAVTGVVDEYYFVDLEEPFNHSRDFFFFQGAFGRIKYACDVRDGVERMAKWFLEEPAQKERWCRLAEDDQVLRSLLNECGVAFNFNAEYLKKRD